MLSGDQRDCASLGDLLKTCVNLRLCDQRFKFCPLGQVRCPSAVHALSMAYGMTSFSHCLLHNVSLHDNQVVRQRWVVAGVAGLGVLALPQLPKHRQAEWQTLVRIQGPEAWEVLVAGEGAGSGAWLRPPRAQRRYNSTH